MSLKKIVNSLHRYYKKSFESKHPLLTSIIIGTAIILFWRGLWGLADMYLLPGNEEASYALSAIIGLVILLLHDGWTELKEIE